jgi:hypothetical protein
MNTDSPGVWIPLNQLLALPLPAEPLASLWRELLRSLPATASSERLALEQALQAHGLRQLQARVDAGELEVGFSLLDGLAPELEPELLAELLNRLMPSLHHALVELAGPDPTPEVVADPRRAECLWLADQWMRRLEALPGQACELRPLMAEHLCRYAAVAWLAQPPAARWRKLDLLQRLVLLQPEARSWAVPAIRDRLLEGVQELQQDEGIADPLHLAALLQACAAMEHDPQLPQQAREALQLAVFRGRAALEVWQNLEQLSSPTP